ncbi:MAG: thermonuclease family protein [Magnetococcales bacterium]|nr:thermonuclease family protein [Magnetococcales bacterium]
MRLTIFMLVGILLLSPSGAVCSGNGGRTYGDLEGVVYRGNHDGDTIRFDIPGVHPLFGENIPVRVRGMDAPEIRAHCPLEKERAVRAREMVRERLSKAARITLVEMGRDKYFRIVARVVADGVDVGEMLLRAGLAVPYDGGRKNMDWCETR